MTIQSSSSSVTYTGNASATVFPFPFIIPDASNLVVSIFDSTTLAETDLAPAAYAVNGIGETLGGFVTYPLSGASLPTTQTITIRRVLPLIQNTDIVNQSAFYPETIEDALDYQMMVSQQLQEQVGRALVAPAGSNLDTTAFLQAVVTNASDASIWAASAQDNAILAAYWASTAQAFAVGAASAITYDPTASGLASTNVQDAIDELAAAAVSTTAFVGQIADSAALAIPSLWLACDGSAHLRSTYSFLWAALSKTATVTMTIASPAVVTWTGHGLRDGDPIAFSTSGALPTGVVANTVYYLVSSSTNTFRIAATPGGSAINTAGSQSGTHTGLYAPWGIGNGTTTFNLPDLRQRATYGWDTGTTRLTNATGVGIDGRTLGASGGVESVTLSISQIPSHNHSEGADSVVSTTGGVIHNVPTSTTGNSHSEGPVNTGSTGGDGAHNNMPPGIVVRKIIYAGQ